MSNTDSPCRLRDKILTCRISMLSKILTSSRTHTSRISMRIKFHWRYNKPRGWLPLMLVSKSSLRRN